jgi:hypothetical protein
VLVVGVLLLKGLWPKEVDEVPNGADPDLCNKVPSREKKKEHAREMINSRPGFPLTAPLKGSREPDQTRKLILKTKNYFSPSRTGGHHRLSAARMAAHF